MQDQDKLPRDLVWQADGHLTDIALSALGDGEQALLERDALGHAEACAACSARLGGAALLSLATGDALRERAASAADQPAAAPAPAPAARPLPVAALVAALCLAALGAAPSFLADAGQLPATLARVRHGLGVVLRTGRDVAESGALGIGGWLTALAWIAAALLVLAGLGVARATKKPLSLEGGM